MVKQAFKWALGRVDRWIRPLFYALFFAALSAEAWLIFCADEATHTKFLIPGTILLSAIMATCGWMWSGHINRRLNRKTQALSVLMFIRNEQVNEWKTNAYEYIRLKSEKKTANIPHEDVEKLLGVYEFVAISVMSGSADEDMIKESQKYVFLRLYQGLRDYIEERQKDHPSIYCHLVHYATEWNDGVSIFKPSYIGKEPEFFV